MHLCRPNYQLDFHYASAVCYDWERQVVVVFRGPWFVKVRVVTVVKPPSSIELKDAVTTVSVIVLD